MRHKVFVRFFGTVEGIELAKLDLRSPQTVFGLAAVYRSKVAIVSPRQLARITPAFSRLCEAF